MNDVLPTLLGNAFNLTHSIAATHPKTPLSLKHYPHRSLEFTHKTPKDQSGPGLDTGNRPPRPPARKKKKQTFKFQWP